MLRVEDLWLYLNSSDFGLDFDVSDQGDIIFFEANSTMNLLPHQTDKFPHPEIATQRLTEAFDAYFTKRIALN